MAGTKLYERLGGYNAIAAVVDSLMAKMGEDARISRYFVGHGDDSKRRLRQLQMDMICEATGGPCFYTGRDMKAVHKGLGISGTEWQTMISYLIGILENFGVAETEQKEVLSLLSGLKGDIVEKP
ncbi:MAG: group 1 truncated hemoglobin [Methanotrichaceae archaeon]|nr:group 1 truncated hemoglobin [Methanotrichaceae archaeon]